MADRPAIHVTLKPALAEVVQQAIESGEYASQDEVVSEALLEWRLRRELNPTERDALCRLWDEGVASGPGRFGSMDEITQEARRRLKRRWGT
jgi:antitoxin ParD1/3/4